MSDLPSLTPEALVRLRAYHLERRALMWKKLEDAEQALKSADSDKDRRSGVSNVRRYQAEIASLDEQLTEGGDPAGGGISRF